MEPLINEFLKHCKNRYSTESMRQLSWQIGKFHLYLEARRLDFHLISKNAIETFLLSVTQSQQIRRKMLDTISSFYEFVNTYYPENTIQNPCCNLHVGRGKPCGLPRVPPAREITAALSGASGGREINNLRNRAMLELAYGSGLRRTEIVRLNVTDIDRHGMTARISGKGDRVRVVPLTHTACEAMRVYLLERKAACGPLFVAHPQGTRLNPFSLNLIFKKNGGIRPHLYRHACATHMLGNGCNIRIIQELLGHKYLTTTQVYTHINKHDLSRVINRNHPRAKTRSALIPIPAV